MPQAPPAFSQEFVVPTANSFIVQPLPGRPVYYAPQQIPAPVGSYPVQAIPVGNEVPAVNGPVLQPATGQQFVNPAAYAPR